MLRSASSLAMALALALLCACDSDPCEDADCAPVRNVREGDDHGDSLEAATPLEPMEPFHWVNANLDNPKDVDLFSFHVKAGRIYRFGCHGFGSGYRPSCSVELLGADGLTLPGSMATVGVTNHQSSVLATQEGTVYARVKSFSPESGFVPYYEYSLLDRGPDELANTLAEATPVSVGTTVSGTIEPAGEADIAALDAVAGRTYRLSCSGFANSHNCGMRVRSPEGELLYESKFNSRDTIETFDLQVPRGGRYTVELFVIVVSSLYTGVSNYVLSIVDLEP
ncbi:MULTISPECIES: hypothetical protein [unclassified Corallococcus]|uniref:hypothetical protein n=1 Tax=unclassified Corallococcus TaxID=2685029 RepID=UPI001A9039C4|nr:MULTISPECIES: hypothetical protein [unclassified Corallococcus]MBN9680997.1 hypothetical protein [Corallococcus sp. NCSPR001]WAS87408.1 hypothetical protein O0N60_10600 [Corallococcus sp. NCRR]